MEQLPQIIEKFNAGTATEEEKLLLLTALQKQDPALQHWLQDAYQADLDKKIVELPSGRSAQLLEAIKSRIPQRQVVPLTVYRPWYKRSAPWAAAAAILVAVVGIFLYISKTNRPGEPVIVSGSPIAPVLKQLHNTGASAMIIQLEDHSTVALQPNSTISYTPNFAINKREIQLSGKALFKVAKDAKRPFTVFTHGIATTALGTQFTVNTQEAGNVIVKLLEGRVVIHPADSSHPGMRPVYLQPGQEAIANLLQHTCKIQPAPKEGITDNAVANTTAGNTSTGFNYNRTPLEQVLQQLSKHYQVHFQYNKNQVKDLRFTGTLVAEDSLDAILNILGTTNNLNFTRNHNNIVITKQP